MPCVIKFKQNKIKTEMKALRQGKESKKNGIRIIEKAE